MSTITPYHLANKKNKSQWDSHLAEKVSFQEIRISILYILRTFHRSI